MPKPRILILGKVPPPYMGPSVMTETILNSSLKQSFELRHFDTSLNRKLERIGRIGPGKVLKLLKQYRSFSKTLKKERPELVVVPLSQTPGGLIKDLRFVRIAHRAGIRTLAYLHGGELDRTLQESSKVLRAHAEKALELLDGAIVLGEGLRRIFRPYLEDERIFTVPNGMDIAPPEKQRPDPPPFRLLFLSNPIQRKGIEDLIDAVDLLVQKGYDISLEVAGEWFEASLEKSCREKVRTQDLPVTFHPPMDEQAKKELLQKAHLFILPPREPEGLPVALIEALAHGLPIISTSKGAIPELVEQEGNGYLVLPNDPASIADKVLGLMENPELREWFGVRSRELYLTRFTEERLSENLYHCFKTLLEQPIRG